MVLVYFAGSFMPHQTTICLTEVNRPIEQCFAFACNGLIITKTIPGVQIELSDGQVKQMGDRGKLITGNAQYPFEIADFIPNYRVSAVLLNPAKKRKIQLSFYRLSRNSTRVVWIDRAASPSNFKRVWMVLQKKQQEKNIQQLLDTAKTQIEKMEDTLTPYADVSAEENPNFSLK